ncbi:MAG: Fur family transcriptional regulator [Deltaproteobacteria bacterium SG8_13]|nr:MAG: Fur family transcriptional regulator [Deltaproteobacteria bacterium SG8_13]
MQQVHRQEKEQFKKLFQQEHIDRFEDRFRVLEVFLQTEEHLTADELIEVLERSGYGFSVDFVRDTLKLMCRFGFASKNRFDNGVVRYEHRHLGQHHDHLICTKCKGIFEFQNNRLEDLQLRIAADRGFHMLQHRMEIYGICSECLRDRSQTIALNAAKQGERLVIKEINGGSGARMRLMTMGLRIGDKVEVITNQNRGQMVIAVDFKRFVLGKGLAEKILVEQDT